MKERELQLNQITNAEIVPISQEARQMLTFYEQTIAPSHVIDIGAATEIVPKYANETPPKALREYVIYYPESLIEAYKIVCNTYDQVFMDVVKAHKDYPSDYQFAPFNLAFQVDGPAYSEEFLEYAANVSPEILAEVITMRMFECENNLAMYGLNGRLWPEGTTNPTWHEALDQVRQRTGKKVAVLAGTEKKLDEMVQSELYTDREHMPSQEAIRNLTGFDAFWGPANVKAHFLKHKGQDSEYVFFGRTSRPKEWLKEPLTHVEEELALSLDLLSYVRKFAITHNFDKAGLPLNHTDIIMDSKEALVKIGAAYQVRQLPDIYSSEFLAYLAQNGIDLEAIEGGILTERQKNKLGGLFATFPSDHMLSEKFIAHLQARGADPEQIANGSSSLRAKPLKLHYGVYGHVTGSINRSNFLNKLMKEIRQRGSYILQPELKNLQIVNSNNFAEKFIAIDRVFFVRDAQGNLAPMESVRSLMPLDSPDGRENNVHEGKYTRCARIAI